MLFQFTRPHGARPAAIGITVAAINFNSRARMGRDGSYDCRRKSTNKFQFTRPHGARRQDEHDAPHNGWISIHAPAWGATVITLYHHDLHNFNSRARMGRDVNKQTEWTNRIIFQFTRPHGARLVQVFSFKSCLKISIHAPAWGATKFTIDTPPALNISIHAPAWGATHIAKIYTVSKGISIHAPAWGAT